MCLELREKSNEDPTFTRISRIITGDEGWIYGYDPETKQQSSRRKSKIGVAGPEFNKEHAHCFSFFWYVKGTVHHEFVPCNTMVNSDFYCDVLRRLREQVRRERPELWRNHNWLHHEKAPTHTPLKTTEFVTNNNMVIIPHPPYSPDLAPCDFALFPKLKMKLKGPRFATVSDIQRESQVVLDSIKENYFHGGFEAC
jgi:histone-lysine N-methyltransferase SETMAR